MKKTTFFKGKKSYFPQISRLFSVHPIFFVVIGLVFGVFASVLFGLQPQKIIAMSTLDLTKATLHTSDDQVRASYEEWKRIVTNKPDYRDGYVMLAWYAKELGQIDQSKEYIQKVQALDPNYVIPEVLQMETIDNKTYLPAGRQ